MPVWHSSVARWGKRGILNINEMAPADVLKAVAKARRLLHGVGMNELDFFATDPLGSAIHAQKPLSPKEIGQLPAGWMEIPAVDGLGPATLIDPENVLHSLGF